MDKFRKRAAIALAPVLIVAAVAIGVTHTGAAASAPPRPSVALSCNSSSNYVKVTQTAPDVFSTTGSSSSALARMEPNGFIGPFNDPFEFDPPVPFNPITLFTIPGNAISKARITFVPDSDFPTTTDNMNSANGDLGRVYFLNNAYGYDDGDGQESSVQSVEFCVHAA